MRRSIDHRPILLRESSVDYGHTTFHVRHLFLIGPTQKAKIQWAIKGDENSKYFHGIINKKWSQLAIRGVLVDGEWIEDPPQVKNEFLETVLIVLSMPIGSGLLILIQYVSKDFYLDQNADFKRDVS
ncbi:hypothetical protein Tco_1363575 [Tanacetum coccineum]